MKIRDIAIDIIKSTPSVCVQLAGEVNEFSVRRAVRDFILAGAGQGSSEITLPVIGRREGFSLIACAKILSQEILRAGREGAGNIRRIHVTTETDEDLRVVEKQVFGYLKHVTEDMSWGPYVTTDIIIEIDGGVVLIERTNPPFGWALPGGFVDRGESLEAAARREAKEETALDLEGLKQFHTYSDPERDPRFHTISTVFTARGKGCPQAGDDAKGLRVVPLAEVANLKLAFDHATVIRDYLSAREQRAGL